MKSNLHVCHLDTIKQTRCSVGRGKSFRLLVTLSAALLSVLTVAVSAKADALTGLYTCVAAGDPDFYGGANAPTISIMGTGMIQSGLGPNGLPVLSASGIASLGTSSDMNATTHELLWWSAGADPYVGWDANPVQINSMPLNFGYPNVDWYPTGQTGNSSYFRTVQWQGIFTMPTAGSISLNLQVDDDAWVFIDGTLVAENHYGSVSDTSTPVGAGTHFLKLFYDDRFPVYDAINFSSSVPLEAVPEPGSATLLVGSVILLFARKFRSR